MLPASHSAEEPHRSMMKTIEHNFAHRSWPTILVGALGKAPTVPRVPEVFG
jgi:hypothetical protein